MTKVKLLLAKLALLGLLSTLANRANSPSWCLSVEPLSPSFRVDTNYGLATDGLTSTNFTAKTAQPRQRETDVQQEKKRKKKGPFDFVLRRIPNNLALAPHLSPPRREDALSQPPGVFFAPFPRVLLSIWQPIGKTCARDRPFALLRFAFSPFPTEP